MKKILLATDFSKASEKVVHYALTLFDDAACEFTLFYSYGLLVPQGMESFMLDNIKAVAVQSMEEFVDKIRQYDGLQYHQFKYELLATSPSSSIELLQQKHQYDLIVVGSSGLADDVYLGNEATDIIRNVETNTLVVPYDVLIKPTQNIVLALDYHQVQDYSFFESLKDLVKRKNATLTLLTILKEQEMPKDIDKMVRFEYHNYFKDINTIDYFIKNNEVENGIKEYLDNHEVDILAMVSRHHSFLDVVFDRSTTRHVALHPEVTMLSIYEQSGNLPNSELITY